MGKKTDKVFHLTVAALALTLGVVSVGTVVYQKHPAWMQQWLKKYNLNSTGPLSSLSNNPGGTAAGSGNGAASGQGSASGSASGQGSRSGQGTGADNTGANNTGAKTVGDASNSASGSAAGGSRTGANTNSTGGGAASRTGARSSDVALKPGYTMTDNNILISVKGAASDVTTADVKHVQTTLDTYKIVSLVSQSLQMNIYQELYILVAKTPADYQKALSGLGVSTSDAKQFTMDTGGFAQGDTIVIPLYQNKTTADLANTLSHELTHAFLNMNVGSSFPSWINEGLAVTDGMHAQAKAEGSVAYDGYARQMAESILDAQKNGSLQPLEADEAKVLAGNAPYDLELQDWLAVRDLVNQFGFGAFSDYFYRLNLGESEATAFKRSFGASESAFNTQFTNQLKAVLKTPNDGVQITFQSPSNFHGAIRFLQHGLTSWTGFRPTVGQNTITIASNGSVTPAKHLTTPIQDSNPADNTTLYVNLDPNVSLTYKGQTVKNSGFAIDYHYGMYGFVNAWITLANGKSMYFHTPSLFGVSITKLQETAANKWFTDLMAPPALGTSTQSVPASSSGNGSGGGSAGT